MSATTETSRPEVPRPEVADPPSWAFPAYETHTLGNGLTALVYHLPGQYAVAARLGVPLRLSAEPREVEGVGTIMARTLTEGTERYSAQEFAVLLEREGVAIGAGVGDTSLEVDLDVAVNHLGAALELMRQVVAEPAFPESEVKREVRTRLADIEQERANPGSRAAQTMLGLLFAEGERASRPTRGSAATVAAITRDSVVEFYAQHVGPRGAVLALAGDFTDVDVVGSLEATLGQWENPHQVELEDPAPSAYADDRDRIVIVDRPGSVQSELVVTCPGPDRHIDGGWSPYPVLSFVVGGAPNARVDQVLREEKGFTYGIRSVFRPRRGAGSFNTSGSVRADSTVEALGLLLDILRDARDGFSDTEIRSGVDFISMTAPGRYATAGAVADEAITMAMDGLSTETTTQNLAAMKLVDADLAGQAYRRFVDGNFAVVVVGDADQIEDGIRGLDRGEVTVIRSSE